MNKLGTYEHINAKNNATAKPYEYNISSFKKDDRAEWVHVPRWHEHLELKLILSGSAEIFCGTELFVAGPGDIVIINPYELHGLRVHGEDDLRYYCLMLAPDFPFSPALAERYAQLFAGKYSFGRILSDCTPANTVFSALFEELTKETSEYELHAESYISLLYTMLLRHASVLDSAADYLNFRQYGERILPALNYIHLHYMDDISIPMLSELCSMSMYHFCRVFKTVIGCTAVTYLNTLRLNKATLLLTTTKMPISEIALSVGFPDELYFSRRFKLLRGLSPTKYRTISSEEQTPTPIEQNNP